MSNDSFGVSLQINKTKLREAIADAVTVKINGELDHPAKSLKTTENVIDALIETLQEERENMYFCAELAKTLGIMLNWDRVSVVKDMLEQWVEKGDLDKEDAKKAKQLIQELLS